MSPLLLDTHTAIWLVGNERIAREAEEIFGRDRNEVIGWIMGNGGGNDKAKDLFGLFDDSIARLLAAK